MLIALEAFGVTFSGLADEARFEAAQSLLLKDKRIAEVAAVLGFAEQSAFTRAFMRWSGTTPGRWRLQRAGAIGNRRDGAPRAQASMRSTRTKPSLRPASWVRGPEAASLVDVRQNLSARPAGLR